MATIVVETGTGSETSNSYVSEADLATYAADRGVTLTGTAAVLITNFCNLVSAAVK